MKLQLFIAHNGGVSRRKAFDHVLAGDVTVNGLSVREPSHMIEPTEDKVALFGQEIRPRAYEYIMLNKPAGYVTTCEAQRDQRFVMSLLPPDKRHLKPVGRLDKDTEGLLFFTNDGELANRLAHPSFDVNKTYRVRVVRRMEPREKERLEKGVVIEKFRTAPAEVDNMRFDAGHTEFDLTIHEGHKRQVRLMCHEVGHDVVALVRIAQGPLRLESLKSGAWRVLSAEEVSLLRSIGRSSGKTLRDKPQGVRPVFQSKFAGRRSSTDRDWHSGQAAGPADTRPRNEQGERVGPAPQKPKLNFGFRGPSSVQGERREPRPFSRDARPRDDRPRAARPAERREYKPFNKDGRSTDDRPRGAYRPREERPGVSRDRVERPRSEPRDRSERPRSDARAAGTSSFKPYKKPFGKKPSAKPYGRPAGQKSYGRSSSGPKSFSRPQR